MQHLAAAPVEQLTAATDMCPARANMPFISIVMPVRNEQFYLRHTIESLMHQDYPNHCFEVIVADGRSTDNTTGIVRQLQLEYPNLILVDNPQRLSSAGRNAAIQHARGDCILIIDGHCWIQDDLHLTRIGDTLARTQADCLGRPQPLETTNANLLQRAIAAARSSLLGHHPTSHIYSKSEAFVPPHSVAVCYRRAVLDRVGPFDENFDACEDVEYNHRVHQAGFRCFFSPAIAVSYYPRSSLSGLFRQLVRYGRGRVRLLLKHPATFSSLGFAPGAFVIWLLAGILLTVVHPTLVPPYAASLLLYAAIICGYSARVAITHTSLRLFPLLPVVLFVIHFASGWGILLEIVSTFLTKWQVSRMILARRY